jgi:hypothetical protein
MLPIRADHSFKPTALPTIMLDGAPEKARRCPMRYWVQRRRLTERNQPPEQWTWKQHQQPLRM